MHFDRLEKVAHARALRAAVSLLSCYSWWVLAIGLDRLLLISEAPLRIPGRYWLSSWSRYPPVTIAALLVCGLFVWAMCARPRFGTWEAVLIGVVTVLLAYTTHRVTLRF